MCYFIKVLSAPYLQLVLEQDMACHLVDGGTRMQLEHPSLSKSLTMTPSSKVSNKPENLPTKRRKSSDMLVKTKQIASHVVSSLVLQLYIIIEINMYSFRSWISH
jgi:hypothetical protein